MRERVRRIGAGAAIALGLAHLVYSLLAFKALTPEYVWFAGAGVAMICVGLSSWRAPALIESALMMVYLVVMVSLMPLPQVFLGLAIFITLLATSLTRRKV